MAWQQYNIYDLNHKIQYMKILYNQKFVTDSNQELEFRRDYSFSCA